MLSGGLLSGGLLSGGLLSRSLLDGSRAAPTRSTRLPASLAPALQQLERPLALVTIGAPSPKVKQVYEALKAEAAKSAK